MRGFLIYFKFCFILILLIYSDLLFAQSGKGSPVVQNYLPKSYKDVSNSAQNWCFVQDKRGVMYIGNTEGLMEYDGKKFRIHHTVNNSIVRSLDLDAAGRIYMGGSGDFGYMSVNNKGESYFVSLSMLLKPKDRNFTDVWATYATKSGVYFITSNKIFKYKDRKIKIIYSTFRLSAFKAFDRIFLINKGGSGIYRIDKDRFELLPNTQGLKAVTIAETNDNSLIGITSDNSFFTYNLQNFNKKATIQPFHTVLDKLNGTSLPYYFQIKKTNNNQFIVNTLYNGVYLINNFGRIINSFNVQNGLLSNNVYNLYLDSDSRLWFALDKGISNIDLNSPITVFNSENGLIGTPSSLINFKNHIYIGTEKNIFKLSNTKYGQGELTEILNYQSNVAWNFLDFNNNLLVASSNGLYQINDVTAEKIDATPNIYCLSQHPHKKNDLIIGTENSIINLETSNKEIDNKISILKSTIIVDKTNPIKSMAVDKAGNFWASSNFKGIYFLHFIPDQKSLPPYTLADTTQGLNTLSGNQVTKINGEVYITSNNFVYQTKINLDESIHFIKNESYYDLLNKNKTNVDQLFEDPKGKIWMFSEKKGFGEIIKSKNNKLEWIYSRFLSIPSYEINKFVVDENDVVWGLSNNSIYRIELGIISSKSKGFNALIREVRLPKDSIIFAGDYHTKVKTAEGIEVVTSLKQPFSKIKEINYKNNSLIFDYTSTSYTNENQIQYSYWLEGFESNWSEWSNITSKEYNQLFEGDYTFHVKSRNTFGKISEKAEYIFSITPPWYRSIWSYIFYLLILFFLFRRAYIYLTSKHKKDKSRLELLIKERTSLISHKNIELEKNRIEVEAQKEQLEKQSKVFETMSKEHEKLSIVASKTENAVLIMDSTGDFEWVNESYERMFGYNLKELTKLNSPNIISENTPTYVKEAIEKCFNEKTSVGYEFATMSKNGEKIWVQVTLTPILDDQNNIYKLIAVDTDITKTKNTEIELIKRSDEIKSQINLFDNQNEYIYKQKEKIKLLKTFTQTIFNLEDFRIINNETNLFLSQFLDTTYFGIGIYNKTRELIEFNNFKENGLSLPYFTNDIFQKNSFSSWSIRNKKEILISDIEKKFHLYLDDEPEFETIVPPKSLICVPLLLKGEAVGVITIYSLQESAYKDDDLHLITIVASFIASSFTNLNYIKQLKGLENQISDSIEHGKGALNLILPEKSSIDRFYKSFIINRPMDFISGDFYWFTKIASDEQMLKTIVVIGDCTGHDNTGAYISMLTMYLLSEIVDRRKIYQPARILELLDEKLINYLSVNGDNIELAVCLLELLPDGSSNLIFSGAKRPIHIFQSTQNEVTTIKGTRRLLGDKKTSSLIAFKSENIVLNSGDLVYLATDGMNNQSNALSQKFSVDKLCKVLKDNAYRPLQEQKERLEFAFDFFKGNEKQRDDIVVLAIKV